MHRLSPCSRVLNYFFHAESGIALDLFLNSEQNEPRVHIEKEIKFRENLPNSQKFRGPTQSGRSQGSQR